VCGQVVFAGGGGRYITFEQLPGCVLCFCQWGEAKLRRRRSTPPECGGVLHLLFVFLSASRLLGGGAAG